MTLRYAGVNVLHQAGELDELIGGVETLTCAG
jgi:hypothetical protein